MKLRNYVFTPLQKEEAIISIKDKKGFYIKLEWVFLSKMEIKKVRR